MGKDQRGYFPIINLVGNISKISPNLDGLFMHSKFFLCLEMSQDYDKKFVESSEKTPRNCYPGNNYHHNPPLRVLAQ